jgi:Glycosyl transferases group 1
VARVLFYRNYDRFFGGHLKVWHYFNHVRQTPGYEPYVRFSRHSRWDDTNPWWGLPECRVGRTFRPDLRFLAGLDWEFLSERRRRRPDIPVLNLIQHTRHAEPSDRRFAFLSHPAIRICVSEDVTEAIRATGRVAGPVITIPNGIDRGELPAIIPPAARPIDLLVAAAKQPDLGTRLYDQLAGPGVRSRLLTAPIPRVEFLATLAASRVAVLLPHVSEGFFLPALEAMALDTLVVCPDCVGNRSFCHDLRTGWHPAYRAELLVQATKTALALPDDRAEAIRRAARDEVSAHDLAEERRLFRQVLDDVSRLWAA